MPVSAFVECFLVSGAAWSKDALSDEREDSLCGVFCLLASMVIPSPL